MAVARPQIQTPFQKVRFVDQDGRLMPEALQLLQQLVRNTQGEDPASGTIRLGPINIHYGTGAPGGVVTGSPPDLYLNLSGGASTTLYVKESGAATTGGWVAK